MTYLDNDVDWDDIPPWEPPEEFGQRNGQRGGQSTEFERTWLPADLSDVLDGTWKAAEPTVGSRSDGVGLFYRGKQHTVASESEGGKTWFLLAAALDEISAGQHVVYLDFEDDRGPVVGRLLALGALPDAIRQYFHYIRPESPVVVGPNTADIECLMAEFAPTLAVVDGVTEAMTLHGLNPLDNADAAKFGRLVPRRLARSGAAVVSLDHVTKSTESRGRYSLGAVHKLNGLDGAAYVLDNRKPFGVGIEGVSTIRIAKDRPGQLRKHALPNTQGLHWFGDLVLDSTGWQAEAVVKAPNSDESAQPTKPTMMMQRVADAPAEHPEGLAQRVLDHVVKGRAATIRAALAHLIADGYVSNKTPHKLLKSYPDGDETQ
jgi:AAA domain